MEESLNNDLNSIIEVSSIKKLEKSVSNNRKEVVSTNSDESESTINKSETSGLVFGQTTETTNKNGFESAEKDDFDINSVIVEKHSGQEPKDITNREGFESAESGDLDINSVVVKTVYNESWKEPKDITNKDGFESAKKGDLHINSVVVETMDKEAGQESRNITNNNSFVSAEKDDLDNNSGVVEMNDRDSEGETFTIRKKHVAIIDSDSDDDTQIETRIESTNIEAETYTTGSKGELILETSKNPSLKKNKWAALCDSESSEDVRDKEASEHIPNEYEKLSGEDEEKVPTPKLYKRKSKPKVAKDLPKKMTGKDALKLRKEIQSESQRMLRETKVSLPYHRPKQFTLKEFLSKRPKLSSAVTLPVKVPPSVAIKMQKEQLEIISEKLKQREKEVKEFYKSDSGSDNDDDNDPEYLPDRNELKEDTNSIIENQDTEKSENDEVNNSDNNINTLVSSAQTIDSAIDSQGKTIDFESNDSEHADGLTADCNKETEVEESNVDNEVDVENSQSAGELVSDIIKDTDNINQTQTDMVDAKYQDDETPTDAINKTSITERNRSDDFEFNLDGIEESECFNINSEQQTTGEEDKETVECLRSQNDTQNSVEAIDGENEKNFSKQTRRNSFRNDELDKEIEEFGDKLTNVKNNVSLSDLLREQFGNIKPRLSGSPDEVIDLDSGVTKPSEIVSLMKRFERHTAKTNVHKNKVKLNVVSVASQGIIEKEVVSMEIDDESQEIEEKPGVRLQRLRNELQEQIAKQKIEHWQKKSAKPNEKPTSGDENEDWSSKPDYEADVDDILDDEDEEEMSESSDEEEIESDEDKTSSKKKKSAFIDDEAEDSDVDNQEEDDNVEVIGNNEGNTDSDKENEDVRELDIDENSESTSIKEKQVSGLIRKPLRRIVKGFTEDSDEEDNSGVTTKANIVDKIVDQPQEDDDIIPPHQVRNDQTPVKSTSQQRQNSFGFDFLTPVSYITGIKNLTNAVTKSAKGSPIMSPFRLPINPNLPSPLKESDWQSSLQKKLFNDNETTDSQTMADICSGEFPLTQSLVENRIEENEKPNQNTSLPSPSESFPNTIPSTQDLMNICSGKFTGSLEASENPEKNDTSSAGNNTEILEINETDKRKSSDLDHEIISQLLDEEEMEQFKKKFDSPGTTTTQREIGERKDDVEEVKASGIIDSDDEDAEGMQIKRKKNKSKLTFSDDSSDSEGEDETEEEIDLYDKDDEDENEVEDRPPDDLEYDSEENEIELEEDGDEEGTKNLRPADFFDEEAELSESEWGSADEDEKDLDRLEMEAGDNEKFDEKQLRRDLEKIHMRRMLDEDQREVKLLQELLLEDGELHGTGRERKFRWKNIDAADGEEQAKSDDDVYLDEDESEEQWRRKRYERELFLKEKQKSLQLNDDDDDDDAVDLLGDSQILRIGQKLLKRNSSVSNSLPNTPNDSQEEISVNTVKSSFIYQSKRGSFLSRGEAVLQRLAEFNKVNDTVVIGATAKNSRKFLFKTVSVDGSSTSVVQDKKRKATEGTPNVIKKLRLSDTLSPANRQKKTAEPTARAKLF